MSLKKAIGAAVRLYEDFREESPRKVGSARVNIPKAVAVMGYVEGIDYRTTHGKKLTLYHHDFEAGSRPLLAVSSDGRQLLLLGGRYQFTEQGIVDKDARGRLITNPKHGRAINPKKRRKRNARAGDFGRMEPADVSRVREVVNREQKALRMKLQAPSRTPRESALLRQYAATYGLGAPMGVQPGRKANARRKAPELTHAEAIGLVAGYAADGLKSLLDLQQHWIGHRDYVAERTAGDTVAELSAMLCEYVDAAAWPEGFKGKRSPASKTGLTAPVERAAKRRAKALTRGQAHETVDEAEQLGALAYLAQHWDVPGHWNEHATWTADTLHAIVDESAEALQDRRYSGKNPKDSDKTELAEWPGIL
jgi:hypothetical protein